MTIEERLEHALATDQPALALRSLAGELSQEGRTRQEIYTALESLLVRLRAHPGSRESQEDAVLEVMDSLTGWCHPGAELLPEERPAG
jgi:hypothetical protein